MRIVISPAKQMKVDTDIFEPTSTPVFIDRTEMLMEWIRSLSYEEQKALWQCNDKIAKTNSKRFETMLYDRDARLVKKIPAFPKL